MAHSLRIQLVTGRVENKVSSVQAYDYAITRAGQYIFTTPSEGLKWIGNVQLLSVQFSGRFGIYVNLLINLGGWRLSMLTWNIRLLFLPFPAPLVDKNPGKEKHPSHSRGFVFSLMRLSVPFVAVSHNIYILVA